MKTALGKRFDLSFTVLLSVLSLVMVFLPISLGTSKPTVPSAVKALVLSVDDTHMEQYGITKVGQQSVMVRILSGTYAGKEIKGVNRLLGKMELDTVYEPGMKVLATPYVKDGKLMGATLVGYDRLPYECMLLVLFSIFLALFAGMTGIKALVSFLFSGAMIWKVMLPVFLKGFDPVLVSMIVVLLLSAVILFLIGEMTKKGLASFLGTASGIIVTWLLATVFTRLFRLSGAVKPFTETLLYSGYAYLNLTKIFIAGVFLAASGAVMDISMDVAAAMEEVKRHNPTLARKELVFSGLRVGRSVIGTMTTTLLLAYSSNYMGLLMVFMAQGTPMVQMLNLNYVAAEILNTMVGSFGLVLTAPLTAIVAGFLYAKNGAGT